MFADALSTNEFSMDLQSRSVDLFMLEQVAKWLESLKKLTSLHLQTTNGDTLGLFLVYHEVDT